MQAVPGVGGERLGGVPDIRKISGDHHKITGKFSNNLKITIDIMERRMKIFTIGLVENDPPIPPVELLNAVGTMHSRSVDT